MAEVHKDIIENLYTNTYTVARAVERVALLRQAVEAVLYQDSGDDVVELYTAALAEHGRPEEVAAVQAWGTDWLPALTVEIWRSTDDALAAWLERVPTQVLYVPVMMDMEGEELLGTWCREARGATTLLDLQVDPNTVGGCALVENGQYVDLSLAAQLNAKPGIVPAIIQSYDR